jgi:hypothetical protein
MIEPSREALDGIATNVDKHRNQLDGVNWWK